jgi:hypothetical protein
VRVRVNNLVAELKTQFVWQVLPHAPSQVGS